jgi:hypothetical protein
VITESEQKRLNTVKHLALENDLNFINYNLLYDELNLDFKVDTIDGSHLNISGGTKLSKHLANVLWKTGLSDHRKDSEYVRWNIWAEKVMEDLYQR